MSSASLPFNLLPAGAKLMHIHVSCRPDGGQHVAGTRCYAVEMTGTAQDAGAQTLFFMETTFSPLVVQIVRDLCHLLPWAGRCWLEAEALMQSCRFRFL